MSEFDEKLGALLGNPQLMQQIINMAQSLGQSSPEPEPPPRQESPPNSPDIDPAMIGNILSLAGKTNIDGNQKALLCALEPYLSKIRLQKLEKAMRAARLADTASQFLQGGAIPFFSGR